MSKSAEATIEERKTLILRADEELRAKAEHAGTIGPGRDHPGRRGCAPKALM